MKKKRVILTDKSQPEALRERMIEAQMSHGTRANVDIQNVRVAQHPQIDGAVVAYFCDAYPIKVNKSLQKGDGKPLAQNATFSNRMDLDVEEGVNEYFNLRNVELVSNSSNHIISLPETVWEKVAQPA